MDGTSSPNGGLCGDNPLTFHVSYSFPRRRGIGGLQKWRRGTGVRATSPGQQVPPRRRALSHVRAQDYPQPLRPSPSARIPVWAPFVTGTAAAPKAPAASGRVPITTETEGGHHSPGGTAQRVSTVALSQPVDTATALGLRPAHDGALQVAVWNGISDLLPHPQCPRGMSGHCPVPCHEAPPGPAVRVYPDVFSCGPQCTPTPWPHSAPPEPYFCAGPLCSAGPGAPQSAETLVGGVTPGGGGRCWRSAWGCRTPHRTRSGRGMHAAGSGQGISMQCRRRGGLP